jgi:hypothetical protein
MSNGRNRRYADTLVSLINFNVRQNDSILMLDRAITVNTTDKFRNQYVEATIAVPIGHHIKIDKNFGYINRVKYQFFTQNPDWFYYNNDNDNDFDYNYGEEYVMKEDGLYTLNGERSDGRDQDWNSNSTEGNTTPGTNENGGSYRYDGNSKTDSLKTNQERQIQKMQATVDSMKAAREKELNHLKDSLNKVKEEIDQKIEKLNKRTAQHLNNNEQKVPENYTFIMYI